MNEYNSQKPFEDEIDIIALLKTIWKKRKWIIQRTFIFTLIGLFIALLSPAEFTASSLFVPNSSYKTGSSSGLNGLASLAGINLNSGGGNEISPIIYHKILESAQFRQQILDIKLPYAQDSISFREYSLNKPKSVISLVKKYTIGLPGIIIGWFKEETKGLKSTNSILRISQEEAGLFRYLEEIIQIIFNEKDYYIELTVTLDNPMFSAIVAFEAEKLLQKEVIKIKVKQSKEMLKYVEERYDVQKKIMYLTQNSLANFKDRNFAISSASFENNQTRLEQEYQNANAVFQEVSKQLEQVKLQVSRDTPVFSIIKPVVVPTKKSAPNKKMILMIWTILGLISTTGYVLIEQPFKELLKELEK